MTTEEQVLTHIVRALESLGIPYMVTGSVASSFHGKPRTTHDADVVIDPTPEALAVALREVMSDRTRAIRMGEAGATEAAKMTWPAAVETLLK